MKPVKVKTECGGEKSSSSSSDNKKEEGEEEDDEDEDKYDPDLDLEADFPQGEYQPCMGLETCQCSGSESESVRNKHCHNVKQE